MDSKISEILNDIKGKCDLMAQLLAATPKAPEPDTQLKFEMTNQIEELKHILENKDVELKAQAEHCAALLKEVADLKKQVIAVESKIPKIK
jgi:septal ring factor EnvC (AmiA/AmiB activator)